MGKFMGSPQRTWSVRSYVVGFAMHLWWPNGANWRQQYWWRSILYQGRRATRMCIESAVVFVCSGGGPWMLASEGWQCWRGFSGWHAHTLGSKIRRRYPSFCKNVWGNKIFVGRTGDMFGRSGAATECAENKSTDNSVTKSQRGASSKWTSNWGVRPWLYTQMVGMHVMHSEYWQSYFSFGTSSPCCVESFLCKQAILGKQECCNARPLQVFQRHGHSCCLFRCCPQKNIQTRSV